MVSAQRVELFGVAWRRGVRPSASRHLPAPSMRRTRRQCGERREIVLRVRRRTPRSARSWAARKRRRAGTVVVQRTHRAAPSSADAAISRFYVWRATATRAASAQRAGLPDRRRPETRPLLDDARHPAAPPTSRGCGVRSATTPSGAASTRPNFPCETPAPLTASRWRRLDAPASAAAPASPAKWRYARIAALGWHWGMGRTPRARPASSAYSPEGAWRRARWAARGGRLRGFRWRRLPRRRLDRRFGGHPGGLRRSEARLLGRRAAAILRDPTWFPFFPLRNHLADHQVYQTLVVPQRFSGASDARRRRPSSVRAVKPPGLVCGARSPSLWRLRTLVHAGRADRAARASPVPIRSALLLQLDLDRRCSGRRRRSGTIAGSGRPPGQLMHRVRDAATYSVNTDVHAHATWRGATRKRSRRRPKIWDISRSSRLSA